MYKALYISPMIPSSNLKETTLFFTELFNFKIHLNDLNYTIIYKDNLTIHISQSDEHLNELEFYLQVDNIDYLWNSIKDQLKHLKVKAPFDQEYGMREFHIEVPFTKAIMFVGQDLKQT